MALVFVGWAPYVWDPHVWGDHVWEMVELPTVTSACPLPPAAKDLAYSYQVLFSDDLPGDATVVVSSGALPDGLSLDPETGLISGTPTDDGVWEFCLQVQWGAVTSEAFCCAIEVRDTRPASSGCARDFLVIGSAKGSVSRGLIYLPDALDSFESDLSVEDGTIFAIRSKAYAPLGTDGEVVWRRLYISGYARGTAGLWVTPILDGRPLHDLRTWFQAPSPSSGTMERFHFLLPLGRIASDYPDQAQGARGSALSVQIETTDPADVWHLETVGFAHDPIKETRSRRAGEMETE